MNPTNDDLKLVASKIMGWPEWVDENKDPASLPAWWINDLGILIVERSDGSDLWNPIEYDADSHELLKRLHEIQNPIVTQKQKTGWCVCTYIGETSRFELEEYGDTLNAALFAFAVKLAKESK